MRTVIEAAQTSGSILTELIVIGAAAIAVWVRTHGRATWIEQRDLRRHPARASRFAMVAASIVAGAALVVGMAVTAKPRPVVPRGQIVTVRDPESSARAATFVLFDPVPGGRVRLDALSSSGASY